VNNLGVALLSQGKLKEVRSYLFLGRTVSVVLTSPLALPFLDGHAGHRGVGGSFKPESV